MDKLDQYFDKARKTDEIIPMSGIESILSREDETRQSPHILYALLHRKELLYIATSVLVAGVIFLFMVLSSEKIIMRPDHVVFIPDQQQRIMHLVSAIAAHPKKSLITLSQFGSGSGSEAATIPMHLRTKFELPKDKLKLLGITLTTAQIKYEGNVIGKGYLSFSVKGFWSQSVSLDGNEKKGVPRFAFYPWFMSDEHGIQTVRYRLDGEDSLKMTNAFFTSVIDQLIPVEVNHFGTSKTVFWFAQSPDLMRILESVASVSESDKFYAPEKAEDSPEIKIFPTITTGKVTIAAQIVREQNMEITVLTSSGEVIRRVNKQKLAIGSHSFDLELSELKEGLHFIRIKSTPGVITMHRIIKE